MGLTIFTEARVFATLDIILSRSQVLLPAAALLAFGAALAGGFHLDDYSLFSNPDITSSAGFIRLWGPLATRPLTNSTFWLNFTLGARNPFGYHLVNLALHIAAVAILLGILKKLVSIPAALVAAGIFALHPIQAEAVNYVFERGTLIATLLCLLSLRDWLAERPWRAVAWFAAALLAKEECVAFPVFLLLFELSSRRTRRPAGPLTAMFVLSAAAGVRVLLAAAYTPGSAAGAQAGVPWQTYLLTEGLVILRYFRLLLLPWGFTVDPDIHPESGPLAWIAWIAIAATVLLSLRYFRNLRAGFWFIAGLALLLPSSSVFPASDFAADRRMYLPLIGFSVCLGILLERVDKRVLATAALVLAAISLQRTLVWRTETSLWTDAVAKSPEKIRPKIQLSRALPPAGAATVLEEAQRIAPGDPMVASEQGRVYLAMGQAPQALGSFGRALALRPGDPMAINNRGVALMALSQNAAAEQDFHRALSIDPCQFDARLNLARLGIREPVPSQCRFTPEETRKLEGN